MTPPSLAASVSDQRMVSRWIRTSLIAALTSVVAFIPAPVAGGDDATTGKAPDLDGWASILTERTVRNVLVSPTGEIDADRERAIAIVTAATSTYAELISAERAAAVQARVHYAEVDRVYTTVVLEPQLTSSREDAHRIFDTHRNGYRKAPGVSLLEIFLWAPEDLPEFRLHRLATIEELRRTARDRASFSTAAEKYSDATSYQNGGNIGVILADQVGDRLRKTLFTNELGPTDIVSNRHGHYLFFVVDKTPPRERAFNEVADQILSKLRARELQSLRKTDNERLLAALAVVLEPGESDHGETRIFEINGKGYTAPNARIEPGLTGGRLAAAIEKRALQIAREDSLRDLDITVETPSERVDFALFTAIQPRLAEIQLRESTVGLPSAASESSEFKPPRAVPKWDFQLLSVADSGGDSNLYRLLHLRHELGDTRPLEAYRDALIQDSNVTVKIVRHDGVLASDAAALGPEIFRTLKHHLQVGQVSRPLHLRDRGRFVLVRLTREATDIEAGRREQAARKERRARSAARAEVERRLLAGEPIPTPGSTAQEE